MKTIYICLFLIINSAVAASCQCKTGDCNNGKGSYDYGWCIYTGEFKNGKAEGTGTMKYDDYTYTGQFKNGVEDGRGVIVYKDGRKENVMYSAGTKTSFEPIKLAEGEYKSLEGQDDECIRGNCRTGFGTVQFPSGNKYTGNFVNRKRQGKGVFYFANGDKFEGVFNNDLKESGTYSFNNGHTYTGTYLNDDFYNGTFTAPSGQKVNMVNGMVIASRKIAVTDEKSAGAANCANKETCPHCHGKQIVSKPIEQKLSWSQKDTYSVDSRGNRTLTWAGQSGGNTYSIPNYGACDRCGGRGFICK